MHDDSSLHFRPGVSYDDQGKCITLELYFTFKGQLQRSHKLSLFDRFRHVENGLDINF